MNIKDIIKQIILDFHENEIPFHIKRPDVSLPKDNGRLIHTIIGPRRSGKTYKMYEIIQDLIDNGIDKTRIVFISFDDNRLEGFTVKDFEYILESYIELHEFNTKDCYFFFDEIQNIKGWESFIRRLYDTITRHIYITGSNSKLLSTEIATSLRGRSISTEVLPLSFGEYLMFKKINIQNVSKIKKALNEYLYYGSYPEITLINDKDTKIKLLQNYFDSIVYKDIVERYSIADTFVLRRFMIELLDKNARLFSVNKIVNDFKSQKIATSNQTLSIYTQYMQSVYFAKVLLNHDRSIRKIQNGEKKFFVVDNGMYVANIGLIESKKSNGFLLESAVYQELLKRKEADVYFYRKNDAECDFLIDNSKNKLAIQVSVNVDDTDTKEREVKGLISGMNRLGIKNGIIITNTDYEEAISKKGVKIKFVPAWKWFLEV